MADQPASHGASRDHRRDQIDDDRLTRSADAGADPSHDEYFQANVRPRTRFLQSIRRKIFVGIGGAFIFGILLAALAVTVLSTRIFYRIGPGEVGVHYRLFAGGTQVDSSFPEGLQWIWPFDRIYIYNLRIQTVLHEFSVLTNKGLPINLRLAIRFHPEEEMIGLLHKHVGQDYVETIVIPQIESALRRNIGQQDPEDIYTNKSGILTEIIALAIEETGQKYVFVDDIIIRRVDLPPEIEDAIAKKLVYQQHLAAYEFRLAIEEKELDRVVIESEGVSRAHEKIGSTLTGDLLTWELIRANRQIALSNNAKVILMPSDGAPGTLLTLPVETPPKAETPPDETEAISSLAEAVPAPPDAPQIPGQYELRVNLP